MESTPLVSVPVITYNSSKYVLETLESIKAQTYQNIELIISDDCSIDNTVQICKDWIEHNRNRFIRVIMLESPINTGVSANGNRAREVCTGEWIKSIAGDDILFPNCIKEYVDYINKHPNAIYVFSRVNVFGDDQQKIEYFNNTIFDYSFFSLDSDKQYRWLITREFQPIPAATSFFNFKRSYELNISNDERLPMLEDWPKWIRLLEKGVKFDFINKELVGYRVSGSQICSGTIHSKQFAKSIYKMYFLYQFLPKIKLEGIVSATRTYVAYKNAYYEKQNIFWKMMWKGWRLFEKDALKKLPH